ncbi:MAG: hypothetical protein ACI8UO_005831 [Verrucomicrobiales bacterium]|jgi:hypothetical protein
MTSEKAQFFYERIIRHPRIIELADDVLSWIDAPSGPNIMIVVGPTGVGKTTQQDQILRKLHESKQQSINANPGIMPYLRVEAPAPTGSSFGWRDLYFRILDAMWEPLIGDKQIPARPIDSLAVQPPSNRAPAAELCRAVESCIRNRQAEVLIIDEAQHFLMMGSGRRLRDQLDCLKSLSNLSGVKLLLIGTYDLLELSRLNGQLARRCQPLHFARYRCDDADDWRSFQNVVATFQANLPLHAGFDLLDKAKFLYERSCGCVGILKTWLDQALGLALRNGTGISRSILTKTALPVGTIQTIAEEIQRGEARYREIEEGISNRALKDLLGLNVFEPPVATSPKARVKRKPGERQPKRDPVGIPS